MMPSALLPQISPCDADASTNPWTRVSHRIVSRSSALGSCEVCVAAKAMRRPWAITEVRSPLQLVAGSVCGFDKPPAHVLRRLTLRFGNPIDHEPPHLGRRRRGDLSKQRLGVHSELNGCPVHDRKANHHVPPVGNCRLDCVSDKPCPHPPLRHLSSAPVGGRQAAYTTMQRANTEA